MLLWEHLSPYYEREGGGPHIHIQCQQLKCEGPYCISHSKVGDAQQENTEDDNNRDISFLQYMLKLQIQKAH